MFEYSEWLILAIEISVLRYRAYKVEKAELELWGKMMENQLIDSGVIHSKSSGRRNGATGSQDQ